MKEKVLDFLKKNYILVICAGCVFISLIALITALVSGGSSGSGEGSGEADSSSVQMIDTRWGEGITEGIPAFSAEPESVKGNNQSVAAYFKNVSSEQADEYLKTLESELNIEFGKGDYPKSANYGEKIIALQYNADKQELSVTVVE